MNHHWGPYIRDTAQPTVVTLSYTSSWTSKVNSIHYAIPIINPLNGLLPHASSCDYARFDLMSTGAWEDARSTRGLKADVREAWKRRRKKTSAIRPESPPLHHRSLRTRLHPRLRHPRGALWNSARSLGRSPDRSLRPKPGVSALSTSESPAQVGLRVWNGPLAHVSTI